MNTHIRHTLLYIVCAVLLTMAAMPHTLRAQEAVRTSGGLVLNNVTAERAGDFLLVGMDLCFDGVDVPSNRMLAYSPVVRGRNGESVVLPAVLLTGRRQHYVYLREGSAAYPDAREVRRDNGRPQTEHYTHSIPFEQWMAHATVSLIEDSCGCGLSFASRVDDVLRLHGRPRTPVCAYIVPVPAEVKAYAIEGRAYLDFPVNRTEIHPDYRRNPQELLKIVESIDRVRNDSNAVIKAVAIHGYASPEGPYANNERLSKGRAAALRDYVRNLYRFGDDVRFSIDNTPEDWAGLDSLVARSNLGMKDELLALIRSDMEPDERDGEIKRRWPEAYRFMLGTWYPALRRSDYTVSYEVKPFTTPESAKRIYLEKPEQLSLNELYMVAGTYPTGSDSWAGVFETAVRLYPDSPTANLNVANVAIANNDLDTAERHLARAGQTPQAVHARGIVALLRGDYAEARRLLEEARGAGVTEAEENLRILGEVED